MQPSQHSSGKKWSYLVPLSQVKGTSWLLCSLNVDPLNSLFDIIQEGLALRRVFMLRVVVHISQCVHIGFEIMLADGSLQGEMRHVRLEVKGAEMATWKKKKQVNKQTWTRSAAFHRENDGGRALLYHLRQLNVCEAVNEGLAKAGELLQKAVVVLFDHLVLLLYCLQVTFHRRDLLSGYKTRER